MPLYQVQMEITYDNTRYLEVGVTSLAGEDLSVNFPVRFRFQTKLEAQTGRQSTLQVMGVDSAWPCHEPAIVQRT